MNSKLTVTLCRTREEKPLAVVDGLPGDYAELTPAQLRDLADRLLHIAHDAQNQPMHGNAYREKRREYTLLLPASVVPSVPSPEKPMHWYALSKATGVATLCASEQDARREAEEYDNLYPLGAPHVATRLVPIDSGLLAAAQRTLEENLHLADGEACTLIHLKRAVNELVADEGQS